ncbi:MAG: acyltransferase [Bacteroidetes bacterium]|nr:MAG: acyltransferase [Bacteroidota bacterium]
MPKRILKWLFHDVWGWKVSGQLPIESKYLIVVAPHTSNWDFLVGLFYRKLTDNFNPKYLAKKELFVFPIGYFFRWVGGYPVERVKNTHFVDALVEVYNTNEEFITTITPEGTRSFNSKWKTGFYYVAKKANIPILRIAFDYGSKTLVIDDIYQVNKELDETIIDFKIWFSQYKGKNSENGVKWPE